MQEIKTQKTSGNAFINTRIRRLRMLAALFVIWVVAIIVKLFSVQLIHTEAYHLLAKRQYERKVTLEAERGIIYDRNMNKLAVNLIHYSFAADPSFMKESDKDRVAENFSRVFKRSKSEYRKLLSRPTAFVWLERRISENSARAINDSIQGLIKLKSLRRQYPYGKAAASIVGITNMDNQGVSGIEMSLEDSLSGDNGWAILQADALGRLQPSPVYPHKDPNNGKNVVLTMDVNYQTLAYHELEKAVADYNADDAMAVVMSPKTGEILAMVNYPGFDPNNSEKYDAELSRNRTISDLYEPGSTFKAFSAVAALEENVRKPGDRIFCENGQLKIYDQIIHDSKKHGMLTFTQVVEQSSNIGIIKITDKLGSEKFYQYIRAFGFGSETGVDMYGEAKGELKHPLQWSGLTRPMISIGQEIGVTPLQMANAYCAIANGGHLNKPFLIKAVTDGREVGKAAETDPLIIRTIASKETMSQVSAMLREAVVVGTGRRAQIKGIEIAGKTGTAQKIENGSKTYAKDRYIASFAGFFPVQNPQLTFLVIINNPRKSIWGEISAALAARAIVEKIINSSDDYAKSINRVMAELERDSTANKNEQDPDVKYLTLDAARNILEKMHVGYRVAGTGDMVVKQNWIYDNATNKKMLLLLTGNQITLNEMPSDSLPQGSLKRIPDVRGLSARMAINKFYEAGMDVKIKGSGFVIAQFPRAGTAVQSGEPCVIECKPNM